MSEPTSAMAEAVAPDDDPLPDLGPPPGNSPPPESGWRRLIVPSLAVMAIARGAGGLGGWPQLNPPPKSTPASALTWCAGAGCPVALPGLRHPARAPGARL